MNMNQVRRRYEALMDSQSYVMSLRSDVERTTRERMRKEIQTKIDEAKEDSDDRRALIAQRAILEHKPPLNPVGVMTEVARLTTLIAIATEEAYKATIADVENSSNKNGKVLTGPTGIVGPDGEPVN